MPFYFFWDNTFLLLIPAILISIIAQAKISSAFHKYAQIDSERGIQAQSAAEVVLASGGLDHISIEHISGTLSDHYDPHRQVIRLSDSVYQSSSIAAIAVAAHEAGHALQHAQRYVPLKLRGALLPVVQLASNLAFPLLLAGILFGLADLAYIAAIAFGAVFLFQLVTLPVEFNASRRALHALESQRILERQEITGAKKVLSAAALTYVAATLTALLQFVRFLLLANRRRN